MASAGALSEFCTEEAAVELLEKAKKAVTR
jgi:hypothetical protein